MFVVNYDLGMMKEKGGSLRPCKATKTIPLSANIGIYTYLFLSAV